jgi:hypothetical protein
MEGSTCCRKRAAEDVDDIFVTGAPRPNAENPLNNRVIGTSRGGAVNALAMSKVSACETLGLLRVRV